jgi:hypothetical protein
MLRSNPSFIRLMISAVLPERSRFLMAAPCRAKWGILPLPLPRPLSLSRLSQMSHSPRAFLAPLVKVLRGEFPAAEC